MLLFGRGRLPLRLLKRLAGGPGRELAPCRNLRGTVPNSVLPPKVRGEGDAASLDLDGRACGLELSLDLLGLLFRHALLDGLVAGLDEILGLLEAEIGDRTDLLDDVDLLVTGRF